MQRIGNVFIGFGNGELPVTRTGITSQGEAKVLPIVTLPMREHGAASSSNSRKCWQDRCTTVAVAQFDVPGTTVKSDCQCQVCDLLAAEQQACAVSVGDDAIPRGGQYFDGLIDAAIHDLRPRVDDKLQAVHSVAFQPHTG